MGTYGIYDRNCPAEWTLFEDSCIFVTQNKMTWNKGKLHCEALGATLAVLENRSLYNAVKSLSSSKKILVGGYQNTSTGDWHWLNGNVAQWTDWKTGQPDNYGQIEDC